jgi:hypothetical protein
MRAIFTAVSFRLVLLEGFGTYPNAIRRRCPPRPEMDDAPVQNEKARHLPPHLLGCKGMGPSWRRRDTQTKCIVEEIMQSTEKNEV